MPGSLISGCSTAELPFVQPEDDGLLSVYNQCVHCHLSPVSEADPLSAQLDRRLQVLQNLSAGVASEIAEAATARKAEFLGSPLWRSLNRFRSRRCLALVPLAQV